jgi:hypothetical protein
LKCFSSTNTPSYSEEMGIYFSVDGVIMRRQIDRWTFKLGNGEGATET